MRWSVRLQGLVTAGLLLVIGVVPSAAATTAFEGVRQEMQRFVDDKVVAGAVTLVGEAGKIRSLEAVGFADLERAQPMRRDSLFWIASMTKPMVAVTVLMLQDEGRLSVDDPVEKHLPEFKGQRLIETSGPEWLVAIPSPRPITLRDLLTHTSGLADVPSPRVEATLAELVMAYSQQPLRFVPGSRWEYSNSGINTLGRVVEVVSGMEFARFLDDRLLRPLRMRDTTFWPSPSQARRIARSYRQNPATQALEEVAVGLFKGGVTNKRRTPIPAGGLVSSAEDLFRCYSMMLQGGVVGSKRLLSAAAVRQLTSVQTGDLKPGFVEGMSFGFGFAVVNVPVGVTRTLSAGTFGHGGAYATQSWADPATGRISILLIQRAGFPNGDNSPVRKAFHEAVAAAAGRQSD